MACAIKGKNVVYQAKEKRLKEEREDLIEQKETRSNAQALTFARAYLKKNQREMLEANALSAKEVGEKRAAATKSLPRSMR